MAQDKDFKINLELPIVEEDVKIYYFNNMKHIKATIQKVVNRNLDDNEIYRLKRMSMELALEQVADKYKNELGLNNNDSNQ